MPLERLENLTKKWPAFTDLNQGKVFLENRLIDNMEKIIQENKICLIRGAEGRGKTVLVRMFGFIKYSQGWKIYFIDVSEINEVEIQHCCVNIEEFSGKKTLFIIENAHRSLDEITPELVKIANHVVKDKETSFLFTSRKIRPGDEQFVIENPFEEWIEKKLYIDLMPDLKTIKGIIETFIATSRFSYKLNPLSDEDIKWVYGETETNLRRLSWYLKSWCNIGGALSAITKEVVLKQLIKDIIMPLKNPHLQEMLLKVSVVFQYDVSFYGKDYDHALLKTLVERGDITFLLGDYYKLQHSSDADYVVEAWAFLKRKAPDEITTELLQEYMHKKPVNYYVLLRVLYRNKEQKILSNIFEDDKSCVAISDMIKNSPLSKIGDMILLLPEERANSFVQNLDPVKLAEKVKTQNLQKTMWFLKRSLNKSFSKDFLKTFISAISQKELIDEIKNASITTVLELMRLIKQIDQDLHKNIGNRILPSDWLQIWLSSGLNAITKSLGRHLFSIGDERQLAQTIIISLSSKDLTEYIKKIYQQSETYPLEVLSKLLDFAYQIAFETNPQAVKKLAQQIIQKIDLTQQERYNLEQLTLLIRNVEKCDDVLCKELCDRILSDINLSNYLSILFDKRLAILLWQLHKYYPTDNRLQQLAKNIFDLNFKELFNASETEAISLLIWNMLQIDYSRVQDWIKNVEMKEWIQKAKLSSTHDAFWLSWSLYHANKELSKSITQSLSDDLLPSLSEAKTDKLPLLGFFLFCGIQVNPRLIIPPDYEIAYKLSENFGLSELAFFLLFLQKRSNGEKLVKDFSQELTRCMTIKHLVFNVQELLLKHPFDTTRQALQDIFKNFSLPTGRSHEIIFAEMLCLTQTCLKKKGETEIKFGYLRNYFLSNPRHNPLFKNINDSQRWIKIAMQYGIYSYRESPHPEDPDGVVAWLSLNKNNPLVMSTYQQSKT